MRMVLLAVYFKSSQPMQHLAACQFAHCMAYPTLSHMACTPNLIAVASTHPGRGQCIDTNLQELALRKSLICPGE